MKQAFYCILVILIPALVRGQNTILPCTPSSYGGSSYLARLQNNISYPRPTLTVDGTPNSSIFNEVVGSRNHYVQLRVTDLGSMTAKVLNKRFRVKAFVDVYFTTTSATDTMKNIELTVDYRPESGTTFRETDVYKVIVPTTVTNSNIFYTNLKSIELFKWTNATDSVKITAFSDPDLSAAANNYLSWSLTSWTELERYTILNQTVAISPASITPAFTDASQITTDPFIISWPALTGAQEYDIEWTFVDNYVDNSNSSVYPPVISEKLSSQLYYDFKKNSTRVRIPATSTSFALPVIFERGYILFRVRGVGRNPNDLSKPFYSPWSETANSGLVSNFTRRYRVGATLVHEADKLNYQVVTNYYELGKRSDAVSYYDGMMRQRQTVTKSNQDNKIIASDQLYDHDGRPAIQMMPSPIGPISAANRIKFYPNLNGTAAAPYTRTNFEAFNSTTCSIDPQAITNNNTANIPQGPGQYYSPNNVDGTTSGNGYTPQAFGYPFTQVEYTKDNTGRVRRQSGVGRDHKLGSGHETKYYYGTPSQVELDRLFGNEVGDAIHYKKNMVIDPNGQASVSYHDLKGNVIATALAGASPTSLDDLSTTAIAVVDTLLDFTTVDSINHIISVQKTFLVPVSTTYSFNYRVTPQTLSLPNTCKGTTLCLDCIYDLNIKLVRDEACATCNSTTTIPWNSSQTVGQLFNVSGVVDMATCSTTPVNLSSGNITLSPGSYTLTKTLKVNDAAAEAYINAYVANFSETCNVFTSMLTQEMNKIDTLNCNILCSDCADELQAYQTNASNINLENLINCANAATCEDNMPTLCEVAYQTMLDDVSPGGQYCMFSLGTSTDTYTASNEPLSILNTTATNKFPTILVGSTTAARTWQHAGLVYLDDNIPAQTILVNINGTLKTVNSLTLQEFIENFQPVWAKTLVQLHPEYCQYQWCINSAATAYTNNRDAVRTTTYAAANTAGYLNMPSATSDPSIYSNTSRWNNFVAAYKKYYAHPLGSNVYPLRGSTASYTFGVNQANDAAVINTTLKNAAAIAVRYINNPPPAADPCGVGGNLSLLINCATNATTAFGSASLTASDRNKQWEIFRALYQALKSEVLYKESVTYTIANNCYNGCIGTNPFQHAQNGFTNDYNTQPQEPCHNLTASLYQGKRKVFPSINDMETLNAGNINLYTDPNPLALVKYGIVYDSVRNITKIFCDTVAVPTGGSFKGSIGAEFLPSGCLTLTDTLQTGGATPGITVIYSTTGQNCDVCKDAGTFDQTNLSNPCAQYLRNVATRNAQLRYQSFKDSLFLVTKNLYYAKCMKAVELFAASYQDKLYHYTLYYYDQANNLVKTIPPHGINTALFDVVNAATQLSDIRKHRANNHFPKSNTNNTPAAHFPAHTIPTYYQYNSLNQVTYQWSTDGGGTRMVYDELRRLVRSHNANQGKKKFSYTKYDYLNRVVEVGECAYATDQDTLATSTTYANHKILVAGGTRTQITRTRYDYTYSTTINGYFGAAGQENLRGRISTVMYSPTDGTAGGVPVFEQATHYSYDIHGDVKLMFQDHSTFGRKRLDYDYELISGKVRSVTYQKGRWDQFIHYYSYDLNNRLRWVQTSQFPTSVTAPNSGIREQEAEYFYYRHGPLRRVELGSLKVQGIDYAYTIQGWIKGVNSGELKHQFNDIGQDGRPATTNAPVARDAFGYVLGYFSNAGQNDYHAIGTTAQAPVFDRDGYTVGTAAALYNGNIAKMITATRDNDNTTTPGIRSQRMQYRYDQLQRIKRQDAFDWNGTTYAGTTAYAMTLTYDAGGNIKTMTRNGDATALSMDNLTYNYANTGKPNRLTHIADAVPTTTLPDDLETQTANNYTYDKIGNMTGDVSEGGKTVTWNVYNKITTVTLSAGKSLAFGYDAAGNRVRKESTASGVTTKQWYVRDAQGNIMSTYKQVGTGTLKQEHVYLYGSTRVGEYLLNRDSATAWNRHYYRIKGNRHYELTNHLGNVLAVVTDRKMAKDTTADATYTPQFFMPDVYSVQNYYAFGQSMPNWSSTAAVNDPKKYRFGYNGKEDDDEWGKQDYGFRISDPRIGRFLSVDPLAKDYPWNSCYAFAENDVIRSIDLEGAEKAVVINQYVPDANGNPRLGSTNILQVSRTGIGGDLVNFGATGQKDVGILTLDDILVINKGTLPSDISPHSVKREFSPDENTILGAGQDQTSRFDFNPDLKPNQSQGGVSGTGGFTFPGTTPTKDSRKHTLTNSQGTYTEVPVFETQVQTVNVVVMVPFSPVTITGVPVAIDPNSGKVFQSRAAADRPAVNTFNTAMNTVVTNNIPRINITITSTAKQSDYAFLQPRIADGLRALFGYSGTINVTLQPQAADYTGRLTLTAPGGRVQQVTQQQVNVQVQVGTTNQLDPN